MVKFQKKGSSSSSSSSSSSNSPPSSNVDRHFFKVFFPSDSSQRLKIPTTFINNFNGGLPSKVILSDSFRRRWYIEMKRAEGNFFLQNGWQGFVKHHSLILGEFLVFRYDGNSIFEVKIYDHSGCEKEENSANKNINKSACFINKEARDSKPTRDPKRKYSRVLKKIGKPGSVACVNECTQPIRLAGHNVEKEVVSKASGSDNPKPCFKILLNPKKPYHVNIPKQFLIDSNIKLNPTMFLRDPSGKSWPVTIRSPEDGRKLLSTGWVDFCRGNNLIENDQCEFKYLHGRGKGSHVLDVHIKRAKE